jgi:hypothetical protein
MPNSAQERFIAKLRAFKKVDRVRGIRATVYTTYNEVWLCVLYSGGTRQDKYWFGIDTRNVEDWRKQNRVVFCFICGDENTVVFIPDDKFVEWYDRVKPNRKGQWMVNILPRDGKLILHATADRRFDVTGYINRFDFISKSIPLPTALPVLRREQPAALPQEVTEAIMSNSELVGDSLHDRVRDMLTRIGKWMGYIAEKGYKVPPDSPYQIDVVWLDRDLLEVAIEVQIGGNETEAKDRLVHAKRFGSRKIIVVSTPESIKRLKSLCRYEPDLKNWLEIWSIPKVYQMYLSGRQFFELFCPFDKQQWSEEIREFL